MNKSDSTEPGTVPLRRAQLLERVGDLWRGDWTGTNFDGRDGQSWVRTALYGNSGDLDELERILQDVEGCY